MGGIIVQPLLAGLSTGLFCCLTCYPILMPLFVAEQRTWRQNLRGWLQFLAGRLTGYILLGALAGLLGEYLDSTVWHKVANIALMLVAVGMMIYAIGFWRPRRACCAPGPPRARSMPLVFGFLIGLRACPPVILSLTYVFTLQSMASGIIYFLIFFAATCIYLIPLLFAGWLGRMQEFRTAARFSAFLVGILFLIHAILRL